MLLIWNLNIRKDIRKEKEGKAPENLLYEFHQQNRATDLTLPKIFKLGHHVPISA